MANLELLQELIKKLNNNTAGLIIEISSMVIPDKENDYFVIEMKYGEVLLIYKCLSKFSIDHLAGDVLFDIMVKAVDGFALANKNFK